MIARRISLALIAIVILVAGSVSATLPVQMQDATVDEIPAVAVPVVAESDLSVAELNSDPEWYIAPVIPAKHRAPQQAAMATKCLIDSVVTCDIDENATKVSSYDYDAAGNVICVTEWEYKSGVRVGISKQEFGFDASGTQIMSAMYVWDNSANNWRGTEKAEYIYNEAKQMTSNTAYAWVNNEWVPDKKFTYEYDNEGRQTEYYAYARNTATNKLVLANGRIQAWDNAGRQTLDVQYTAYSNGAWSAGAKEVWAFDDEGNQIEYAYYSSLSNGKWVGDTREIWTYTSGKKTYYEKQTWANSTWTGSVKELWEFNASNKQTLHEQYKWATTNWTITLRERSEFDASGNNTLIENYKLVDNVWTGTKKVENTFNAAKKKTSSVSYTWSNGAWIGSEKEIWEFNSSNKQTLHEQYAWEASSWSITLQEKSGYDASGNNTLVENYALENGVWTGTKKEEYVYTSKKKTSAITYSWTDGAWVKFQKEVWGYTSGKQTLHELYEWGNGNWTITLQEKSAYDAAGNTTLVEICKLIDGVWTGEKKEEYTFNAAKQKIVIIVSSWTGSEWVYSTKAEADYRGDEQIMEANYIWQNGAWVGDGYRTETIYEGEQIAMKLAYKWDASAAGWTFLSRRVFAYDNAERLIGDTTQVYTNSAWVNYALQTHGYDSKGHDTLAITADWSGSEWVITYIHQETYTYNADGKLLMIESYEGQPGALVGIQKVENTYDAAGRQIKYVQYEWRNGSWGNKSRFEQTFDDAGNQTLTENYTWDKNSKNKYAWIGTAKYEYAYDYSHNPNGLQTMQARYSWDKKNDKWKGASRTDKEYDEAGNLLASISFSWSSSSSKWVESTRESFTRDSNGKIVEHLLSTWLGAGWGNSEKYEYEYDVKGATKTTRKYSWNGSAWVLYLLEDMEYDLSDNKLRRETSGSWNSGALEYYIDKHYYYSCDAHEFVIRFVNYDGVELASYTVSNGQTPAYDGATPTRPADAQYTYTFAGWDKTPVAATGNVTYTATFSQTKNKYTITFANEDGSTIEAKEYEYGATPVAPSDPTKEATAQFTYTFAGWDKAIVSVTGAATYKATFNATLREYTITFANEDGTTIEAKEWEYGATPVAPSDPTKEATAQYTYTFSGWDKSIAPVTGAATYTATFTATVNKYTITFANEDGTTIEAKEWEYGATPVAPSDPTKPATAQYTFTFAGWDKEIATVTGEATYKATFTAAVNKYTITFQNEDGTTIEAKDWEYGTTPVAPADPTKDATAQYTYTFAGWDKEIATVTGEATYKATFTAITRTYTITWVDGDGNTILTEQVAYGETPTYTGATPTKTATTEHTYEFNNTWSPAIEPVTGDATYTALFIEAGVHPSTVIITYVDDEGNVLFYEMYSYGQTPDPATPGKGSTAQYDYTFSGWSPAIGPATSDATYQATFTATVRSYTITFVNEDGTVLYSEVLEYGKTPEYVGDTPVKAEDENYTYTFSGWTPEIGSVVGTQTYTATYTAAGKVETGITNTDADIPATKVMENGVLYIIRAGQKYTATGAPVYNK